MAGQHGAEFGRPQMRGVDHDIGPAAQRRDQFPLMGDAVGQRPFDGERVQAARLGEAAGQHLVVAIDEQQAQIDEILLKNGVVTVNEVRRARGLAEII